MWRLLLCLTGIWLLAGCGGGAPASGGQQAIVDGLTIVIETPSAPKVLDQAEFTVRLTDASGKPVDGADVYLDLTMPAMPMGSNKPIAEGKGSGVYQASSTFDMAGDWEVTVFATVGGKEHKATFNTSVGK